MTLYWTDDGFRFLCILVTFRQIFIRSLRLLHSHTRLQNIRQKKSLAKKLKPSTTAHSVLLGNRQGMVMYLFNYMRNIRPLNANYHWCEWMNMAWWSTTINSMHHVHAQNRTCKWTKMNDCKLTHKRGECWDKNEWILTRKKNSVEIRK